MSEYSECDRLSDVSDDISTLSEFLEWAQSDGLVLCRLEDTGKICMDETVSEYFPTRESIQNIIYRFFDISPKALETERRQILDLLYKESESL